MQWNRLPYYLKRFAAVRPSEPFVRLSRALRHRREQRVCARDPEDYSMERLWDKRGEWLSAGRVQSARSIAAESLAKKLPGGWWQDAGFWEAFASLYPQEAELIVKKADEIRAGRITLFGWKQMDFDGPITWSSHLSGAEPTREWPREHYAAVRFVHDPSDPERDVKWCWELNRFQHLLLLGAAWKLTRDERYPSAAREQIESWIASVRYPWGIQWSSNLEVALRLLSWIRCHALCMDSAAWDEEFLRWFVPCLNLHCVHIEHELTVHHAISNHLLGEAAALVTAGMLYQCFVRAERWVRKGLRILTDAAPRLILPDGAYGEQSTGYFRFVAEILLPLIHVAHASGTRVPAVLVERTAAGLRFVDAISADLRLVPAIGDADSGHAIGWGLAEYWDFTALAAAGSVLCKADIPRSRKREFPAEAFLMLGPPGRDAFETVGPRAASPARTLDRSGTIWFSYGGYQVIRDAVFHLVFDAGPLGMAPRFGHGHADGLSVIVSYGGKPAAVDAGTFVYNGRPRWREYFRSTAAHNTIAVDRGNQSRALDTFLWDRDLDIGADPPRFGPGWTMLHGFLRSRGATHHRYVVYLVEKMVLVIDRVEGSGPRTLDWSVHWHPQCRVHSAAGSRFSVSTEAGELDLFLSCPDRGVIELLQGQDDPPAGWYSPHYGYKEPCCTLKAGVTASVPAVFLCAVKPKGRVVELHEDVFRLGLPADLVDRWRSSDFASWAVS